jgi:hypothetical protein
MPQGSTMPPTTGRSSQHKSIFREEDFTEALQQLPELGLQKVVLDG